MPGGPLAARILAAGFFTLALGAGLADASGSHANESRWSSVRLTVQVKQSVRFDVPNGSACEFSARPSVSRALTVSGPATLSIGRDGLGAPELNATQLSGIARVGSALPVPLTGGCAADRSAPAAPEACGSYAVNLSPRVRAAHVTRADGAKLQVEISVPRPDGRDGTCAGEGIPEGIRAESTSAASNPFTVIGELPIDSMLQRDGSGDVKSATATMVRNERTSLLDASGHRVGQLRLSQRVVLTLRP